MPSCYWDTVVWWPSHTWLVRLARPCRHKVLLFYFFPSIRFKPLLQRQHVSTCKYTIRRGQRTQPNTKQAAPLSSYNFILFHIYKSLKQHQENVKKHVNIQKSLFQCAFTPFDVPSRIQKYKSFTPKLTEPTHDRPYRSASDSDSSRFHHHQIDWNWSWWWFQKDLVLQTTSVYHTN